MQPSDNVQAELAALRARVAELEADYREGMLVMERPKRPRVVLVTDDDAGDQALYIDGRLVARDDTLYAGDLLGALAKAGVVSGSVAWAERDGDWPDTLESLELTDEEGIGGGDERGGSQ